MIKGRSRERPAFSMKHIVILYGETLDGAGKDEQDTLVQVEAIDRTLRQAGHRVTPVTLSLNLREAADRLRQLAPDAVFNLVESVAGQGRLIHLGPALLDALKLPYTGARTEAMFLTSNKLVAKDALRAVQIPTPERFTLHDAQSDRRIPRRRYIVKSVWEHASVGLSQASVIETEQAADLRQALERLRADSGGEGFAEAFIDGREFNLSLLAGRDGVETLPPAEIAFEDFPADLLKIVDYRAKWDEASFEYMHTVRRFDFPPEDDELLAELQRVAVRCWNAFGLRGYARVDFRVDAERQPFVLEINANPCLSPDAGFSAAAARAGLSYRQVVERILNETEN